MTIMYHALLQLPINGLKQDCVHFVLCPKQANKIEGVVVNGVCISRKFCPKQGQGRSRLTYTQILVEYPLRGSLFSNYGDSW